MAIDWDALVLQPAMEIFGEGTSADQSSLPMYLPAVGGAFPLADAVFDSQSGDVEPDGEISISTVRRPVLGVRLALFTSQPAQSDRVYIPSEDSVFMVVDVRPDGHGWAKLVLMDAKDQSHP